MVKRRRLESGWPARARGFESLLLRLYSESHGSTVDGIPSRSSPSSGAERDSDVASSCDQQVFHLVFSITDSYSASTRSVMVGQPYASAVATPCSPRVS